MQITYGNMNCDFNGRKRKKAKPGGQVYAKPARVVTRPLGGVSRHPREDQPVYPSSHKGSSTTSCAVTPVREVPGYTVSIAYNKGGYQVIPEAEIKHIGK